ncbi:Os09g0381300, partial [Oryza sativa Japonica Group]
EASRSMTGILIYLHDNRCAISLGQSEVIEIKLCLLRILHMFSMDGDFGPLLELIKLHRMYGLLLVMDVVSVFLSLEIHIFFLTIALDSWRSL